MVAPSAGGVLFAVISSLILSTTFISPATANTLGACVKNSSGNIKMVDSEDDCKNNEYYISWNDPGPTGPQGPAGADGADGAQGPIGLTGPAGADGQDGADGAQGPIGSTGPAGIDGQDGADGAQGPIGLAGPAGTDGTNGIDGQDGLACWDLNTNGAPDLPDEDVNGDESVDVLDCAGPQGVTGTDGQDGADGAQGPTGLTGPAGAEGPQGPIGLTGLQGVPGNDGADGQDGAPGATGLQGPIGLTGPAGPADSAGSCTIQTQNQWNAINPGESAIGFLNYVVPILNCSAGFNRTHVDCRLVNKSISFNEPITQMYDRRITETAFQSESECTWTIEARDNPFPDPGYAFEGEITIYAEAITYCQRLWCN